MELTEDQEKLLMQVAAENERKAALNIRKDRTRQMGDVVKQMKKRGFRGDQKIRWQLEDADLLLMRGLAYTIGPDAEWLPEYEAVADWLADNQGKGLLCIGSCGRGKTVITRDVLPFLFQNYINIRFRDGNTGHPVYNYFKATELKSRWDEIERCKIVCIDDIGTESLIEYGRQTNYFAKLVDLCNDKDKLLIGSTNLSIEQMFGGTVEEPDDPDDPDGPQHKVTYPQRYDQRTFSRLVGNTVRVFFEGEDLRLKS